MDTQIYLGILFCHFFFFTDLVEFLCENLKELHSGKKPPGADFVPYCLTLPEGT